LNALILDWVSGYSTCSFSSAGAKWAWPLTSSF
jgi:hypothetical protein